MGLVKSASEGSGMFTFNGAIAALRGSLGMGTRFWFTFSSTSDWKTSFMFVDGNRKTHLRR